jgi:hypothetical protein
MTIRAQLPRSRAAIAAVLLALAFGGSACDTGTGKFEPLGQVDAVEVVFGDRACRRVEQDPERTGLVELADAARTGWEPFWNEPEPSRVRFRFLRGREVVREIGLGSGHLTTEVGERQMFRSIRSTQASRWIAIAGGPPVGVAEGGCQAFDAPVLPL